MKGAVRCSWKPPELDTSFSEWLTACVRLLMHSYSSVATAQGTNGFKAFPTAVSNEHRLLAPSLIIPSIVFKYLRNFHQSNATWVNLSIFLQTCELFLFVNIAALNHCDLRANSPLFTTRSVRERKDKSVKLLGSLTMQFSEGNAWNPGFRPLSHYPISLQAYSTHLFLPTGVSDLQARPFDLYQLCHCHTTRRFFFFFF